MNRLSKIAGVPLVLIALILVILIPLLIADLYIVRAINQLKPSEATKVRVIYPTVTPTPSSTPSAKVSPSPTSLRVVPQASRSGLVK